MIQGEGLGGWETGVPGMADKDRREALSTQLLWLLPGHCPRRKLRYGAAGARPPHQLQCYLLMSLVEIIDPAVLPCTLNAPLPALLFTSGDKR